jgi:hypothetical protein
VNRRSSTSGTSARRSTGAWLENPGLPERHRTVPERVDHLLDIKVGCYVDKMMLPEFSVQPREVVCHGLTPRTRQQATRTSRSAPAWPGRTRWTRAGSCWTLGGGQVRELVLIEHAFRLAMKWRVPTIHVEARPAVLQPVRGHGVHGPPAGRPDHRHDPAKGRRSCAPASWTRPRRISASATTAGPSTG